MIITRTPIRLSFFGGGTDYPVYFRREGGATLAASIDKYTTITVHQLTSFSDCALRVHYSQLENARSLEEVMHPSARECLRRVEIERDIEVHYVNELPARTGLGSSSSATVGLLAALHAYRGRLRSQLDLAEEAVYVEQQMIRERVGVQDQYTCSLGGFIHLKCQTDGSVIPYRLPISADRRLALEERLLLLFTGIRRVAHEVLDEQLERTATGENSAYLRRISELVPRALAALSAGTLRTLGELLHETWTLKRQLSSKVSSPFIDECYDRARRAGAIGGKLLGAGGGGFLLLYTEPGDRERVRSTLGDLAEIKFRFENFGTHMVYYR